MHTVAEQLGIGRTTLYRWIGEREQLIGEVFGLLVDEWVTLVEAQAGGEGVERVLDIMRRFLQFAADSAPLTEFTEREPALALRLMMDRNGRTAERSHQALRRLLDTWTPTLAVSQQIVDVITATAITLVWANLATGQPPDINGAIIVASTLLSACQLASSEPSSNGRPPPR